MSRGLPANEKFTTGDEEIQWSRIVEMTQKQDWKQECLKRDEKFDMYFSSAVGENLRYI